MARKRTGTIQKFTTPDGKVGFKARITLDSGERIWIPVPAGFSEARAREFAAARSERAAGKVLAAPVVPEAPTPARGETCDAWFARLCQDRRDRGQTSVPSDVSRWTRWISPTIGPKAMVEVTKADVEDIRDLLDAAITRYYSTGRSPGNLSPGSAVNVWGTLVGAFGFAGNAKRRDLRVLEGRPNPCDGVLPPERGSRRSKSFIYPSELLAILNCPQIDQAWKETHALACYLYLRPGELRALMLSDIDFEGGRIFITKAWDFVGGSSRQRRLGGRPKSTKTGDSRSVPIEPALMPLLRALHARSSGLGPVAPLLGLVDIDRNAEMLRAQLRAAGITRSELFADSTTEQQVRFRSWRDTGLTWRAIRGDEILRIKRAAGHKSFSTTEGYIVAAEDVNIPPSSVFPPLPQAFLDAAQSSKQSSPMVPVILHPSEVANDCSAESCCANASQNNELAAECGISQSEIPASNAYDGPQGADSTSPDDCPDDSPEARRDEVEGEP